VVGNPLLSRLMAVEQDIFRIEGNIACLDDRIASELGSDISLSREVLATLQDTLALPISVARTSCANGATPFSWHAQRLGRRAR
jgi:hypothetical protein